MTEREQESATGIVRDHLASVLPPGTPPKYREIVSARFFGTGRSRQAIADLVLFDGLPATVRVFGWRRGMAGHCFIDLPGGDCSFEDGRWIRIDRATLEPIPSQLRLDLVHD